MPGFHLPVYDLINDGSLFGRSFAEINAGGFDTFGPVKIYAQICLQAPAE